MTNLCRRCACQPSDGVDRATLLGDGELEYPEFRLTVVAGSDTGSAGSEDGDPARSLDWRSAIVALAVAVLERGGTLVAPANVGLVNLLSQAALPHAHSHGAERLHPQALVESVETGGYSEPGRRMLAPFVHRNALSYLDAERNPVPPEFLRWQGSDELYLQRDAEHHPFRADLAADSLGIVVIHPDDRMLGELDEIVGLRMDRLAVFGSPAAPSDQTPWADKHNPVPDLLGDLIGDLDIRMGALPYGVIMELLVENWLRPADRSFGG